MIICIVYCPLTKLLVDLQADTRVVNTILPENDNLLDFVSSDLYFSVNLDQ